MYQTGKLPDSHRCAEVNQNPYFMRMFSFVALIKTVSCQMQLVAMNGEDSAGGGNEEGGGNYCGDDDLRGW